MSRFKKFIIAFDNHGDMIDADSERVFFKFMADWKPDIRIHGGDCFDFRPLRRKADDEERRESLRLDWDMGLDFFERLRPQHYLLGNHCFSEETEVLTRTGYKKIDAVSPGEELAEVASDGTLRFSTPTAAHRNWHSGHLLNIEGPYNRQVVTPGHEVLMSGVKTKASDLENKKIKASTVSGSARMLPEDQLPAEDNDLVRLLTWVVTDGTVVDYAKYGSPNKIRVQWKLSYPHKIERLKNLLDRMQVPYTFAECKKTGLNKLQPYYIRIYGDWGRTLWQELGRKKEFPNHWRFLPRENLEVFLEELAATDGHLKDATNTWSSTSPSDPIVVTEWCNRNGVECARTTPTPKTTGFPNGKPQTKTVILIRNRKVDMANLSVRRVPYEGFVYCFTMPLGTLLTRMGGKTAVSGNCKRLYDLAEKGGPAADYAYELCRRLEAKAEHLKCKIYPYHKKHGVLQIGHLKVVHGFYAGVYACKQHALVYGSVLHGHIHACDSFSIPGLERRVGRACGALVDLDKLEYNSSQPGSLRHANGFAYGLLDGKTGNYYVEQAEKIGGTWLLPTKFTSY